ncbi:MAG: PHP domain-containing protein [Zoogloeaceae bacterium]|nr:PHP domain-containing protein [Zoogloeaceae bacterium]
MVSPRFDLHVHSTASDGLFTPEAVAARAKARGLDGLALTDHDSVAGLAAARRQAAAEDLVFINGVEISVEWQDTPIHIVGLGFDAAHPGLLAGLKTTQDGRLERARRMDAALAAAGIAGTLAGALRHTAHPAQISRAHFARHLVEIGLFADTGKVFEQYLTPGKPGYVPHRWATLAEAVGWIRAAGGVAVVAHPGRYEISSGQMRVFLGEFRDLGGEAIEVSSGSHVPAHMRRFARLARSFGFHASQGSDFHGGAGADLGGFAPLPEDLPPVWRLLNGDVKK